jgi:hypothetical protein
MVTLPKLFDFGPFLERNCTTCHVYNILDMIITFLLEIILYVSISKEIVALNFEFPSIYATYTKNTCLRMIIRLVKCPYLPQPISHKLKR